MVEEITLGLILYIQIKARLLTCKMKLPLSKEDCEAKDGKAKAECEAKREFSRKVLAPKVIKWMFSPTYRCTGLKGLLNSPPEDRHCSNGQSCHIISFQISKIFSLFLYQLPFRQLNWVEERSPPKPEPCSGSLGMQNGTLHVAFPCMLWQGCWTR